MGQPSNPVDSCEDPATLQSRKRGTADSSPARALPSRSSATEPLSAGNATKESNSLLPPAGQEALLGAIICVISGKVFPGFAEC